MAGRNPQGHLILRRPGQNYRHNHCTHHRRKKVGAGAASISRGFSRESDRQGMQHSRSLACQRSPGAVDQADPSLLGSRAGKWGVYRTLEELNCSSRHFLTALRTSVV